MQALLQAGDLVAEVSRAGVLTRVWVREGSGIDMRKEDLEGRRITELKGNEFACYSAARIAECFETGGRVKFQYSLVDAGRLRSYQVKILPVHPDEDHVFAVLEQVAAGDVNGLVEDKRHDMFEHAFNHSGIGMALLGTDGKWLDVNDAICNITGYPKEELLRLSIYDITFPADKDTHSAFLMQMLRREIKMYTQERRIVSKGKKIVWLSLTVSLVWKEELPKFFIVQVVDITAQKELTDELKLRNVQLEAARVSLLNKIDQLEELSRIIAHNLRGPVGNIRMLSDVLTGNGAEGKRMAGVFTKEEASVMIGECVASLMNNLDVLMEITQIKLNTNIPYNDCNVADMTNEVLAQLHVAIYEKHAEIYLDFEVKEIHYPKVYLKSILYNLLSNAIKYSHPEGLPKIWVSVRLAAGRVALHVKDNGLGIDMERYYDRIFKLNQTFHTGYDSKGLGLYITKTQVEALGGTITVESKPDEGSEFIVTL